MPTPKHTAALAIQLHDHLVGCTLCRMPIDPKGDGVALCPAIREWLDLHFPLQNKAVKSIPVRGTCTLSRDLWWCSNCKRGVGTDGPYSDGFKAGSWAFCPKCGAALDWESADKDSAMRRRLRAQAPVNCRTHEPGECDGTGPACVENV